MTARLVLAGDSAVLVEFDERIDVRINERVVQMARAIEAAGLAGIRDVVPTYRSVAVYFDPLRTDYDALTELLKREAAAGEGPPDRLRQGYGGPPKLYAEAEGGPHRKIAQRKITEHAADVGSGFRRINDRPVRIPVCYGGEFGPDLAEVAAFAKTTESDVIARHTGSVYRVYMMGFLPGFAYLGTVDAVIAIPRRSTPRVRVPAGSVGIAGRQTGIYPLDTPGGWQLVGRTPLTMFDHARSEPFVLKPGDSVQFYPIDAADYVRVKSGSDPEYESTQPPESTRIRGLTPIR